MLQLPLSVTLRVEATFDNFYVSADNQWVVEALQHFCRQPKEFYCYLWGAAGAGVSHLLQASQHILPSDNVQYLPLGEIIHYDYSAQDILSGLDTLDVVVIDDVQHIAGNTEWEEALFHLFNRMRDTGKKMLIGGHQSNVHLPVKLPDLQSRLQWGESYHLQPLDDDAKKQVLISRAASMGLLIKEDVVQFMLNHCGRNLADLMALLKQLDQVCLIGKRAVTIPLVKSVLASPVSL